MENRKLKDSYMLRLPDGWREALKAQAARNRRSMNQEVLAALASALAEAAGGEFGDHTPAAGTIQQTNHHNKEHHHE